MVDVAGSDEDVPKAFLMSQFGDVGDIFDIGEGFGVSVGDAGTAMLQAEGDNIFGREVVMAY